MNIFGIGLPEMAVIFTIALLVFGPKKLPEIGRSFESEFTREAKQLEEAVATSNKPETEKLAAATPKEDTADS